VPVLVPVPVLLPVQFDGSPWCKEHVPVWHIHYLYRGGDDVCVDGFFVLVHFVLSLSGRLFQRRYSVCNRMRCSVTVQ